MASWMIHLRVAEGLIEKLHIENETEFIVGNIAPDSGEPNEDWTVFTPNGFVSHFRKETEDNRKVICEENYIGKYYTPELRAEYSKKQDEFYLGYLTHLLTDKLWIRDITDPTKEKFPEEFARNEGEFWWRIKADWYDLDKLYLKYNPDFKAFKTYAGAEGFVNTYLDFFAEMAFDNRRKYITEFYITGSKEVVERPMYISMQELDAFVDNAVEEIVEYLEELEND